MTWRSLMRELNRMSDSRLNGQAIIYRPSNGFGTGEAEVIEIKQLAVINGDMAEEFDLVEDDPIGIA